VRDAPKAAVVDASDIRGAQLSRPTKTGLSYVRGERMFSAVTNGKRDQEVCELAGLSIQLDQFRVSGARRHALLVHGPWDEGEALWPIAEQLATADIATTLVHFPGCGRTPPQEAIEYASWVAILVALAQRERGAHAGQLIAFGVGLGGTVAFHAAASGAPVDSLWLTAIGDPRRDALRRRILGDAWPPALTTLGLQWLTPVLGDRVWVPPGVLRRTDPADARVPLHSLRWLSSFLTYGPVIEPEAFRAFPVVLVAPTADRWLQLEPSLDFYRRLPGDKQLHMLEGAGHRPVDPLIAEALVRGLSER